MKDQNGERKEQKSRKRKREFNLKSREQKKEKIIEIKNIEQR